MYEKIRALLGDQASLLDYTCSGIPKGQLHLPGGDFVDRILVPSDRPVNVLKNLQWLFSSGRLAGTGYVSILPVDQGIEHSGAAAGSRSQKRRRPWPWSAAGTTERVPTGRTAWRRPSAFSAL